MAEAVNRSTAAKLRRKQIKYRMNLSADLVEGTLIDLPGMGALINGHAWRDGLVKLDPLGTNLAVDKRARLKA